MPYPPSERQYHTRVGWWLMSHDRGGPAVIGAIAAVVLSADLFYTASHWHGSFRHAYLMALSGLAVVALVSLGLRFIPPIGTGRSVIRWKQRTLNVLLVALIVAFVGVSRAGDNEAGAILGEVGGLSGGFALYTVVWLGLHRA